MSGTDKISEIEQLIAEFEASGLREMHVRRGEFEIYLSNDADDPGISGATTQIVANQPPAGRPGKATPAVAEPAKTAASSAADNALAEGAVVVRAPYLGTFYRAPKPGAEPFVEVGQTVSDETEMCLVEVMKLFTAVRAGCAGTVQTVLAEDGAIVEADQPLFVVMPA